MNPLEDVVDSLVPATIVPPTVDDILVVAEEDEILVRTWSPGDSMDEELKTDGLCPGDVPGAIEGPPAWDEAPGAPLCANGDADANARAGIREGVEVDRMDGSGDGSTKEGEGEAGEPPFEILPYRGWGMSWHEWIVTEYPEHGLQSSEVSSPSRDSQG